MTLYGRRISVTVAGLRLSEMRINVQLERQADQTQTTGNVSLYNLSPGHEQQIYERSSTITVEAGYPSTIATIFDGQVQRVRRPRQNLARITYIELGDQSHAEDTLGGVTSRSYDGVVPILQIATDLVGDMGLQLGPVDAIPGSATVYRFRMGWAIR